MRSNVDFLHIDINERTVAVNVTCFWLDMLGSCSHPVTWQNLSNTENLLDVCIYIHFTLKEIQILK